MRVAYGKTLHSCGAQDTNKFSIAFLYREKQIKFFELQPSFYRVQHASSSCKRIQSSSKMKMTRGKQVLEVSLIIIFWQ